jgi:hypothetical protein
MRWMTFSSQHLPGTIRRRKTASSRRPRGRSSASPTGSRHGGALRTRTRRTLNVLALPRPSECAFTRRSIRREGLSCSDLVPSVCCEGPWCAAAFIHADKNLTVSENYAKEVMSGPDKAGGLLKTTTRPLSNWAY